jgi:integrase
MERFGLPLYKHNWCAAPRAWISESFHLACDRDGVPRIRFHETRHTCGTLLHVQGADPFTIQKVLGHSQLSTTRRYTHTLIEVTKPALTRLETLFDPTQRARTQAKSVAKSVDVSKPN